MDIVSPSIYKVLCRGQSNRGAIVKYYKSWQSALTDWIELYGHEFGDPYNLIVEFELHLKQNIRGTYYLVHVSKL